MSRSATALLFLRESLQTVDLNSMTRFEKLNISVKNVDILKIVAEMHQLVGKLSQRDD